MKVSNISLHASERDIREFFSFSGAIEYVEMRGFVSLVSHLCKFVDRIHIIFIHFVFILFEICSESERSQVAYVTFKDSQGADTAALLSVSPFIVVLLLIVTITFECIANIRISSNCF